MAAIAKLGDSAAGRPRALSSVVLLGRSMTLGTNLLDDLPAQCGILSRNGDPLVPYYWPEV